MAARCEICGKGPDSGHNVSHSNRKTNRRFLPNLVSKKIFAQHAGVMVKTKMCTRCLKTMSK